MSEFFKNIPKGEFLAALDAQLRIQVDSTWPKEADALEAHGLSNAATVLDIGTGNGYFLSRLADRYPEKRFTGIENNEALAHAARERIKTAGLTNVEVVLGKCPFAELDRKFDFILARLSIYSMPNRDEVLKWACNLLKDDGRMAIIDADFGQSYTFPPDPAWARMIEVTIHLIEEINGDPRIGRKLPHMLMQAGLCDIRFEQKHWYSSIGMTAEQFRKYWVADSSFIHKADSKTFTDENLRRFHQFLERLESSDTDTAIFPIYVASGRKRQR